MAQKVDHEQRKKAIAKKALRFFSQVGYENVSLLMIAAAMGISRTVLYRYFCSKREVMDASIRMVLSEIETRTKKIVEGRDPTIVKLERVCHAVVDVMFENREFVVAVFDFVMGMVRTGADMNKGILDYTSGTRNVLRRLVEYAKRRGELPEVLIVDRIADAIYAEFESCAMRIVLNTETTPQAAKVRFSDIIRAISIWK